MNNFWKTHKSIILISLVCFIALFFYLKANDDPIWILIRETRLESWFYQFYNANSLIKDISIGILVSTIFWFFNIYLPEIKARKQKIERLNRALKLILEAHDGNPYGWDKHYLHCEPLKKRMTYRLLGK